MYTIQAFLEQNAIKIVLQNTRDLKDTLHIF